MKGPDSAAGNAAESAAAENPDRYNLYLILVDIILVMSRSFTVWKLSFMLH